MRKNKQSVVRPKEAIRKTINDYAEQATFHGISYIFDSSKLPLDRIIWLLICGLFFSLAVYLSAKAYHQWQDDPVLTSVQTTGLPVGKIEYPSVTICSQGWISGVTKKAMARQFWNYGKSKGVELSDLTEEETEKLLQDCLRDLYPGAKVSPAALIQSLGTTGKTSPDKVIESEIVVNNGFDRCVLLGPKAVYCPPEWFPNVDWAFDGNRKDQYYCFKNAGKSHGNVDLCHLSGGQRIWFPANGVYKDLFPVLKNGNNSFGTHFWLDAYADVPDDYNGDNKEYYRAKHDPHLWINAVSSYHHFNSTVAIWSGRDQTNSTHWNMFWDDPWKLLVDEDEILVDEHKIYGFLNYSKSFPNDVNQMNNYGNRCVWAKYLNHSTLIWNLMECNLTMLNNLCMKNATVCSHNSNITSYGGARKKRSGEWITSNGSDDVNTTHKNPIWNYPDFIAGTGSNQGKMLNENNDNASILAVPESPLEFIFNPEKKRDQSFLIDEARTEYRANFNGIDMKSSYNAMFEILWNTQIPCFDVDKVTSSEPYENAMIKSCMWKGKKLPCSKLFTASPTDRGMCCSFNVQSAEEMFNSGDYQSMIQTMQKRDKMLAFDKDTMPDNEKWFTENEVGKFTPQAGVSKGLTLMLDSHSDLLSGSSVSDDFLGFVAVVNDNKQFPITTQKSLLVRPGHYNLVSIEATKVSAKPDIRKYDPEKRWCYFNDENSLESHSKYSQSNCKLECQIRFALNALKKSNQTMCVPWYFPTIKAEYAMCDPWAAQTFLSHMQNIPDVECNNCLPDCEHTEIRASISAAPFRRCDYKNIEVSPLCSLETNDMPYPPKWGRNVLSQYETSYGDIPSYITNVVRTNSRKYINEADREKELFSATNTYEKTYDAYEKDIATVTFFFESSNIYEFLRQPKMTLIDYISQVGGLLGLCLGFSFISAVEIFYWSTFRLMHNLQS